MGKPVAKSTPVALPSSAADLCALYVDTNTEKKTAEKKLETMKSAMMKLVPDGQEKELFPAKRGELAGRYSVTIIKQDRRKIDDEKLIALLLSKNLYTPAMMKTTVDHDKVVQLIEANKITSKDLEACMIGSQPTYPLVTFEEA
jgi:hypothetical protein